MRSGQIDRRPTGTLSFVRPDGDALPVLTTYAVTNHNGVYDGIPVIAAMLGQAEFKEPARFTTGTAMAVVDEAVAIDGDQGFLTQVAALFDRPIAAFLAELCRFAPGGATFLFEPTETTT